MTNPVDLEGLEGLMEKAKTTLPWGGNDNVTYDGVVRTCLFTYEDHSLLTAAVNALPALIATCREAEALRAEVERLRAAISWIEPPFIDDKTPVTELHARIDFVLADIARLDRALLSKGVA